MYPKTFVDRNDYKSSVVVMSAEQEQALPEQYVLVPGSGQVAAPSQPAPSSAQDNEFLVKSSELEADCAALKDKGERFEAYIKHELADLDAKRAALAADMQAHQQAIEQFEAHAAKEKADIEAKRLNDEVKASEEKAPPEQDPAPAKRTRKAD